MSQERSQPAAADGKVLVLLQGLGAVATTYIAGVELYRRQQGRLIGSLAELAKIRLGKRSDPDFRPVRRLVPLPEIEDISFAAWDIFADDARTAAEKAGVLSPAHLDAVGDFLAEIKPMPGVHNPEMVRRLDPDHIVDPKMPKREQAEVLRGNIRDAMEAAGASRAVSVMIMSTEVRQVPGPIHASLEAFEEALDNDDDAISPTQLYAYACLREEVPFANGTPNMALQTEAFRELARETNTPVAGRDLKTGQTMMKTALAPAFKARMLGVAGWFSTNILGNRDGEVLDDPDAFRSKEETKGGVLDSIFQPDEFAELYEDYYHKVRINYYPPRGDEKEGWDNIDIFGWLDYPMQIKVDFLCRDSILAAPIVHDLALFLDLAKRSRWRGTQEWLSFYFKEPMAAPGLYPQHDLFVQLEKLQKRYQLEVLDSQPHDIHIVQIAGPTDRLDSFLEDLGAEHLIEIARTGVTALEK